MGSNFPRLFAILFCNGKTDIIQSTRKYIFLTKVKLYHKLSLMVYRGGFINVQLPGTSMSVYCIVDKDVLFSPNNLV